MIIYYILILLTMFPEFMLCYIISSNFINIYIGVQQLIFIVVLPFPSNLIDSKVVIWSFTSLSKPGSSCLFITSFYYKSCNLGYLDLDRDNILVNVILSFFPFLYYKYYNLVLNLKFILIWEVALYTYEL